MKLSITNKARLENMGLIIYGREDRCFIIKKPNISGNSILNYKSLPILGLTEKYGVEVISDCPVILLWFRETHFILTCQNFVPGPGPGDFAEEFLNEEKLIEFIISYYFGTNKYFEAIKNYEERNQKH